MQGELAKRRIWVRNQLLMLLYDNVNLYSKVPNNRIQHKYIQHKNAMGAVVIRKMQQGDPWPSDCHRINKQYPGVSNILIYLMPTRGINRAHILWHWYSGGFDWRKLVISQLLMYWHLCLHQAAQVCARFPRPWFAKHYRAKQVLKWVRRMTAVARNRFCLNHQRCINFFLQG